MRTSLRYPNPSLQSGSEKAAPINESGGAGLFVGGEPDVDHHRQTDDFGADLEMAEEGKFGYAERQGLELDPLPSLSSFRS
jgi:hypothetical protein